MKIMKMKIFETINIWNYDGCDFIFIIIIVSNIMAMVMIIIVLIPSDDFVYFSTGAIIQEGADVGNDTIIAAGAVVLPGSNGDVKWWW